MNRIEEHILGETGEELEMGTSEESREIATQMVQQCSRYLDIISRGLDPAVYDTPEFSEAVKDLALRSRYSRIRIVIIDVDAMLHRGHRLLNLAQRLTTFIEIRTPGPDHLGLNEAMLIADGAGVIYRRLSDRFDGTANFNDKSLARELLQRFDEIWEKATIDSNLRRLYL